MKIGLEKLHRMTWPGGGRLFGQFASLSDFASWIQYWNERLITLFMFCTLFVTACINIFESISDCLQTAFPTKDFQFLNVKQKRIFKKEVFFSSEVYDEFVTCSHRTPAEICSKRLKNSENNKIPSLWVCLLQKIKNITVVNFEKLNSKENIDSKSWLEFKFNIKTHVKAVTVKTQNSRRYCNVQWQFVPSCQGKQ